MLTKVECTAEDCKYAKDGVCGRKFIEVDWESGCGDRPFCKNYKSFLEEDNP